MRVRTKIRRYFMKEKSQKRITVVNACAKSVHQSNLLSQNMRLVDNLSTLNKNELLLLTFVASKVKKGDTAFEKLVFKPSILSALLNINLADCKTRARFQRDVINLSKKSMVIWRDNNESFIPGPLFSQCQYDRENRQYIFKLNDRMTPYYLVFDKKDPGTIFKYGYIRMLPSVYSRRLYVIAASIKNLAGGIAYTTEKLYAVLGYTDESHNFCSRVLNKAILDINALTDITLQASAIKEGKKIIGYIFKAHAKSKTFMDGQGIYPSELSDLESEKRRIQKLYREPEGTIKGEVVVQNIQYRDLTLKQQTSFERL